MCLDFLLLLLMLFNLGTIKKTDYIKELERHRQADSQEKSAQLFMESLNQRSDNVKTHNFLDVINKILNVQDQSVFYYSGGIRYLSSLLDNGEVKIPLATFIINYNLFLFY